MEETAAVGDGGGLAPQKEGETALSVCLLCSMQCLLAVRGPVLLWAQWDRQQPRPGDRKICITKVSSGGDMTSCLSTWSARQKSMQVLQSIFPLLKPVSEEGY